MHELPREADTAEEVVPSASWAPRSHRAAWAGDLEHLHLVIGEFGVDADAAGPDDGEIERFVPRQVEVAGHGACGAALPGEVGVRVGAG